MSDVMLRTGAVANPPVPAEIPPVNLESYAEAVQLQQGDVLLVPAELPAELVPVLPEGDAYALMPPGRGRNEGSHRLGPVGNVEAYAFQGTPEIAYLRVHDYAVLDHHEHGRIVVTARTWRVVRQRRYVATPDTALQSRPVID